MPSAVSLRTIWPWLVRNAGAFSASASAPGSALAGTPSQERTTVPGSPGQAPNAQPASTTGRAGLAPLPSASWVASPFAMPNRAVEVATTTCVEAAEACCSWASGSLPRSWVLPSARVRTPAWASSTTWSAPIAATCTALRAGPSRYSGSAKASPPGRMTATLPLVETAWITPSRPTDSPAACPATTPSGALPRSATTFWLASSRGTSTSGLSAE